MGLEELLRAATVRVEGGPRPGAGFFLAPGVVVTCVHVTGDVDELEVVWGPDGARVPASVERRLGGRGRPIPDLAADYPDVAVLRVELDGHPCVAIDEDKPKYEDTFQSYGFPAEGGSVLLTAATLAYRGTKGQAPTEFVDLASDTVRPGMSGGPLLNLRSKAVSGVVVATRGPSSPDGGFAVAWDAVRGELADAIAANRDFHAGNRSWHDAARPAGRRVSFRLPLVSTHFSGRSVELEALGQRLARDGRTAVTGLGGVGKSQLAARYVHDHAGEYDLVAWIRAEDGGTADLGDLAGELGEDVEGMAPVDRAQLAVDRLAGSEARWLLVLDNVAAPDQLATCCPSSGNGHVIATSRNRAVGDVLGSFDLGAFDPETGADYLVARTGRADERDAALRLSEALGGLPLALAHAGAYCQAATPFDEYLELLTELPATEVFDSSPEAFYSATVASTWMVSMAAAAESAPLAPAVLAASAYLAPDRIPLAVFRVLPDDPDSARGRKRLRDALNALHRLSLAEVDDTTLSVHRLLQKTVRDQVEGPGPMQAAVAGLIDAYPGQPLEPANWPGCEEAHPHVAALLETLEPGPETADVAWLALATCTYMVAVADRRRGIPVARRAVEFGRRALGDDHAETLRLRLILEALVRGSGRTQDSIAGLEVLVRDLERVLGPEHDDTFRARNWLAGGYRGAGRLEDAVELTERTLADAERVDNADPGIKLALQGERARLYYSAGRPAEALALQRKVVAGWLRVLGDDQVEPLVARLDLGNYLTAAGQVDEAIELLEAVVPEAERILGPDHYDALTGRDRLAGAYLTAGRARESVALREQVVAQSERTLEPDHRALLATRANLALSYEGDGRVDEAIALRQRVVADAERALPPGHPHIAEYEILLVESLSKAGRFSEAIPPAETAVERRARTFGREHELTISMALNLGILYSKAGRHPDAVGLLEKVTDGARDALGPENALTLTGRSVLGAVYGRAGRTDDARALLAEVLTTQERAYGAGDPRAVETRRRLEEVTG